MCNSTLQLRDLYDVHEFYRDLYQLQTNVHAGINRKKMLLSLLLWRGVSCGSGESHFPCLSGRNRWKISVAKGSASTSAFLSLSQILPSQTDKYIPVTVSPFICMYTISGFIRPALRCCCERGTLKVFVLVYDWMEVAVMIFLGCLSLGRHSRKLHLRYINALSTLNLHH